MTDTVSTSWFITFNNPEEKGYTGTPEEICERIVSEWVGDSDTRSCACTYCIAANGLKHCHVVAEDMKPMRFSAIKKTFLIGCHLEPTKGSKKQAEDYIYKRGVFSEKGEEVLFMVSHGDIRGNQGKRTDLEGYYKRLQAGETIQNIIDETPKAYCHLNVLKKMYFDIRSANTPIVRDMKVIWHIGRSGSGKSYERVLLSQLLGEENIYYLTSFNNGSFDNYNGESVLWIEDFRGEFKLQELLRLLDVYKAEVPARYCNVKALWNEVHITSVLTPQQVYQKACTDDYDRIEQLLRRLTSICYHFKDNMGRYRKTYFDPYMNLIDMEKEVEKQIDVFSNYVSVPIQVGDDFYYDLEDLWRAEGETPVGLPSAAPGDKP